MGNKGKFQETVALLFLCVGVFLETPQVKAQPGFRGPGSSRAAPAPQGRVVFEADRATEDPKADVVTLEGNVVVRYLDVEIRAGYVVFHRRGRTLTAQAVNDGTGGVIGHPQFTRGNEKFSGHRMVYDLQSGRGRVWQGRAFSQNKYYIRGEHAVLDSSRNVHLRDISLTTCDEDHEHYRFLVERLKIVENDKGVARNVTFEFGPIPVLWFPFYVFPLRPGGRQSGILTPRFGSNSRDGITVGNLGYYYAPSEYWDAKASFDVRRSGGILVQGLFNYHVRNRMRGSVNLQFENFDTGVSTSTRSFRLNLNHWHRLSPTASLRATGNFTNSLSFDERNADNLYTFLNSQLRSSISLDKDWRDAGRSIDASLTYFRNLESRTNSFQGFPRLTFRQGRRRLVPGGGDRTQRSDAWYHAIYYGLSGDLDHRFSLDPDETDEPEELNIGGRLTVNSQHHLYGWLELTPSFATTQRVSENNTGAPSRRETYSASVSSGTTLYGIFNVNVGRLQGIRHRFQPRAAFRYSQNATITGGTFGFGGTREAGNANRVLDLSLSNTFDVKTVNEKGRERRFTFASARVSTGIDFDTHSTRRVRPVRTNVSIKPDRKVDIRMNMTHELYDEQNAWKPLSPLLRTLSVTSSLRLAGRAVVGQDADRSQRDFDRREPEFDRYGRRSSDFGYERDLNRDIERRGPWRLSVGHRFSHRQTGTTTSRTSWVRGSFVFSPRRYWRIDYSLNVDLVNPDITNQEVLVYRDLHCFEAQLRVVPNGFTRGLAFKFNIKAFPQFGLSHKQGGVYGL